MKITSKTMSAIWGAMRVLTDEDGSSARYMCACSRTRGTPYDLAELYIVLDGGITEEAFQEKYWVCFVVYPEKLEDAARANARESYRGYRLKRDREAAAKKIIEDYDTEFLNIEKKGHL